MSMRGMLIALAVVLAVIAVFWLTGDGSPVREETKAPPKPAAAEVAEEPGGSTDTGAAEAKTGEQKRMPTWKRVMQRGRSSGSAAGEESPAKKAAREAKSTPHAPEGPPQR